MQECLEHRFEAEVLVLPSSEIHVFGDASTSAFGAVLYIVTPPGEECTDGKVCFLMAKGKLTPPLKSQKTKEDSIPRWELQSLVIAGHLVEFVTREVKEIAHCPIYIWGDNRPSLSWCSSDDLQDIYVYRRVTTLRDLCPNANLRHVSTKCNPADLLTKDISAGELLSSELWCKGPS